MNADSDDVARAKIKMNTDGASFMRAFVLRADMLARAQEKRDQVERREKIKAQAMLAAKWASPYVASFAGAMAAFLLCNCLMVGYSWATGKYERQRQHEHHCAARRLHWISKGKMLPGDPPAVDQGGNCAYYPSPPGYPGSLGPAPDANWGVGAVGPPGTVGLPGEGRRCIT